MKPEEALHRAVVAWLNLQPNLFAFHPANGEKRSKGTAGRLKAMGVRAGVPDLVVMWPGRVVFVELKAPGKVKSGAEKDALSPPQLDFYQRSWRWGIPVTVADSIDGVERFLRDLGAPITARATAIHFADAEESLLP